MAWKLLFYGPSLPAFSERWYHRHVLDIFVCLWIQFWSACLFERLTVDVVFCANLYVIGRCTQYAVNITIREIFKY